LKVSRGIAFNSYIINKVAWISKETLVPQDDSTGADGSEVVKDDSSIGENEISSVVEFKPMMYPGIPVSVF
jgi:hypothetical protein